MERRGDRTASEPTPPRASAGGRSIREAPARRAERARQDAPSGRGDAAVAEHVDPECRAARRQAQELRAFVQRLHGAPAAGDPETVHRAAAEGVRGGGGPLPHADRIQASFGRHDVTAIRAHVAGPAARSAHAMGASAYASGDRVAFQSSPDLHTAAHEAAHVVQQRGGVSLQAGIGSRGDAYERHADEVAGLVVAGRSAEAVLDRMAGGRSASGSARVQRKEGPGSSNPPAGNLPSVQGTAPPLASVPTHDECSGRLPGDPKHGSRLQSTPGVGPDAEAPFVSWFTTQMQVVGLAYLDTQRTKTTERQAEVQGMGATEKAEYVRHAQIIRDRKEKLARIAWTEAFKPLRVMLGGEEQVIDWGHPPSKDAITAPSPRALGGWTPSMLVQGLWTLLRLPGPPNQAAAGVFRAELGRRGATVVPSDLLGPELFVQLTTGNFAPPIAAQELEASAATSQEALEIRRELRVLAQTYPFLERMSLEHLSSALAKPTDEERIGDLERGSVAMAGAIQADITQARKKLIADPAKAWLVPELGLATVARLGLRQEHKLEWIQKRAAGASSVEVLLKMVFLGILASLGPVGMIAAGAIGAADLVPATRNYFFLQDVSGGAANQYEALVRQEDLGPSGVMLVLSWTTLLVPTGAASGRAVLRALADTVKRANSGRFSPTELGPWLGARLQQAGVNPSRAGEFVGRLWETLKLYGGFGTPEQRLSFINGHLQRFGWIQKPFTRAELPRAEALWRRYTQLGAIWSEGCPLPKSTTTPGGKLSEQALLDFLALIKRGVIPKEANPLRDRVPGIPANWASSVNPAGGADKYRLERHHLTTRMSHKYNEQNIDRHVAHNDHRIIARDGEYYLILDHNYRNHAIKLEPSGSGTPPAP